LAIVWSLISFCDKFLQEKKPWETKEKKVVSDLITALAEIAKLIEPFLPETSEKILKQIKNKKPIVLFPKA